ncbi:MAG: DUF4124 domain-containing protein [Gammaproteobacteria bacterium]|nr:DUF4124 domain-containing protein [Gammaproteobacteria bacterium]
MSISFGSMEASAKTYKWVDEQGNVHYTQTPPPSGAQKSKQLKVQTERVVKVSKRGKRLFCGNRSLPTSRRKGRASTEIANLQQNIPDWRADIDRVKERRNEFVKRNAGRLRRASTKSRMDQFNQKIAETRCAIGWAENRLAELDGEKGEIVKYHQELEKTYAQVQRRKVDMCGADERTGIVKVDAKLRAYRNCVRPYDRELKKVKRKMKTAKRDVDLINQ